METVFTSRSELNIYKSTYMRPVLTHGTQIGETILLFPRPQDRNYNHGHELKSTPLQGNDGSSGSGSTVGNGGGVGISVPGGFVKVGVGPGSGKQIGVHGGQA
jgi:hypothetical protein